ncbi:hypothetical protein HAX54_032459, partial [Datura stramonium]|nr:hypothetical protein [Datura stramonium]
NDKDTFFHRCVSSRISFPLKMVDYFGIDQLLVNGSVTFLECRKIKAIYLNILCDGCSKFHLITYEHGVRPPHVPNLPSVDHLANLYFQGYTFIGSVTSLVNV